MGTPCLWLLAASAGASPVVAEHTGVYAGEAVTWDSHLRTTSPEELVPLAVPLSADTEVLGGTAVAARDGTGRIVALATRRGDSTLRLRQPVHPEEDVLLPPLVASEAIQRVTLEGAWLDPDPVLGLEKHVRYWASPGVGRDQRLSADRFAGGRPRPSEEAMYLVVDDALSNYGLRGTLVEKGKGAPWGTRLSLVSLLAALLLAMATVFRIVSAEARAERNRAYIDREFGRAKEC